jgi:hypothetical protein
MLELSLINNKDLSRQIMGAAIEVHKLLGPGLPESAHEACLCHELAARSLRFRCDLLVEGRLAVELKSIEGLAPVQESIMLTYLRPSEHKLRLLIDFNVSVLKDGVRRFIMPRENKKLFLNTEGAEATEKKVSAKHAN